MKRIVIGTLLALCACPSVHMAHLLNYEARWVEDREDPRQRPEISVQGPGCVCRGGEKFALTCDTAKTAQVMHLQLDYTVYGASRISTMRNGRLWTEWQSNEHWMGRHRNIRTIYGNNSPETPKKAPLPISGTCQEIGEALCDISDCPP